MSSGVREVTLGDVLKAAPDPVRLEDEVKYPTVGVLSYGRGLFSRPVIFGQETAYSTYFRVRKGQFVYSKLFAWEGALAVVGDEHDDFFVSQEFPVFDLDTSQLLPSYLRLLCQWEELWSRVRNYQTGMGGRRKRVHPKDILGVPFSLPSIAEQEGIVDLFESLDAVIRRAENVATASTRLGMALRSEHFTEFKDSVPAAAMFEITMGRQRAPKYATGEHVVPYLRAANVKRGRLVLDDVKSMNFSPTEQQKFTLRAGDVLVTEGCGSLSELGASAQWQAELSGPVCFQNTLLRLRPLPGVSLANYAMQWAQYCYETGVFAGVASGTNIFHIGAERAALIPVRQTSSTAQEAFLAEVRDADMVAVSASEYVKAANRARKELLASLLAGETQLPETYQLDLVGVA